MNIYVNLRYITEFFLEWGTFQTKVVVKIKTHILLSIIFFSENRSVYEIMWKNTAQIFVFPLQQGLREHALMLRWRTLPILLNKGDGIVWGSVSRGGKKKNSCTFRGSNSGSRTGFNICPRCLIRCCFNEAISLTKSFANRGVFEMISPLTFHLSGGSEPRKFELRWVFYD